MGFKAPARQRVSRSLIFCNKWFYYTEYQIPSAGINKKKKSFKSLLNTLFIVSNRKNKKKIKRKITLNFFIWIIRSIDLFFGGGGEGEGHIENSFQS